MRGKDRGHKVLKMLPNTQKCYMGSQILQGSLKKFLVVEWKKWTGFYDGNHYYLFGTHSWTSW